MRNSVVKLNEQCFRLGSSTICEQSDTAERSGLSILASWQDDGENFILRKEVAYEHDMPPSSSLANMVHDAGTSAGVWLLGKDTFCKVKGWCEGMESESETINFVRMHCPSIPVPEVVFSWIDHDWSRSFTLIKRVPGKTLDEIWPTLSSSQRSGIVCNVVAYCKELSSVTSSKLESATGKGLCDNHLNIAAPDSHPTWKPRLLSPMSSDEFNEFLHQRTSKDAQSIVPSVEEHFLFYHADLGPTNIMISEDTKVTGILDWECAAFFPRFWIALKPGISAGFFLSRESVGEDKAARFGWGDPFYKALMAEGFDSTDNDLAWWKGLAK